MIGDGSVNENGFLWDNEEEAAEQAVTAAGTASPEKTEGSAEPENETERALAQTGEASVPSEGSPAPRRLPRRAVRTVEETDPESGDGKKKTAKPRAQVGRAYKKARNRRIAGRVALSFFSLLAFLVAAVVLTCLVLLKAKHVKATVAVSEELKAMGGEEIRVEETGTVITSALVQSAKQASATKWIPGLFMSGEEIDAIMKESKTVVHETRSIDTLTPAGQSGEGDGDEWADAVDGIRFITLTKPTFQAYLLLVKDPARVFVGWGADYQAGARGGMKVFGIAEKYGATAVINGGEFSDVGGMGTGDLPMGLTFSQGQRYSGDTGKTFMGFDKNNNLVVSEGMSVSRATELGIRDGVSFQTGNALITNDGSNVTVHYAPGNTGVAQRTCIAQRADGTVIMLVTDGRTAQSLGATYNDCIEILLEYGAISAGMLDGGSSAMMYYRNYFDLYHYDTSLLDEYQLQGLVNKYKAFTKPRTIPTYFVVGEAQNNG